MGNVGTFILDLINAEGDPAIEPSCTVDFLRLDDTDILRAPDLQFPPKHSFSLPAFPQERALHCSITPSLYGTVQSSFFTLDDGSTREESAIVLRSPDNWTPKFALWASLSAQFTPLKSILENQFLKLKHGPDIGVLTPSVYDAMASPALLLAKMALLNLFAVLTAQKDPVSGQLWFNFVQQILVLDRERFVAKVSADLFESIDSTLKNPPAFKKDGFFPGKTTLHTEN